MLLEKDIRLKAVRNEPATLTANRSRTRVYLLGGEKKHSLQLPCSRPDVLLYTKRPNSGTLAYCRTVSPLRMSSLPGHREILDGTRRRSRLSAVDRSENKKLAGSFLLSASRDRTSYKVSISVRGRPDRISDSTGKAAISMIAFPVERQPN